MGKWKGNEDDRKGKEREREQEGEKETGGEEVVGRRKVWVGVWKGKEEIIGKGREKEGKERERKRRMEKEKNEKQTNRSKGK